MSLFTNHPRRWMWGLTLLLLLLLTTGLYNWQRSRTRLARVEAMRKELASEASKTLTPEQRKQKFDAIRSEMKQLSAADRSILMTAGMQKAKERMDHYFAMNTREKQKFLDDEINRMQQQKKEAAANAATATRAGQTGTPTGVTGARAGTAPLASGPRPGATNRTPEEIEKRRKEMLNNTTAEQRALRDQMRAQSQRFRADLNQRLAQRGLPQLPANGPGGPAGFGGGPGGGGRPRG